MSSKEIKGAEYAFFGTPDFAAIILKKLVESGLQPKAVVCNPDRPIGRKQIITAPPTKVIAEENGISILQPEHPREISRELSELGCRFFLVAAYAKIIPEEILGIPPLGTIGIHPSLLPRHRGASPIQSAILSGDKATGVTLYLLDEKMDHGPVLAQKALENYESRTMNYETLSVKLAELGAELLVETLPKFLKGEIKPEIQNEEYATYTEKFETKDAFVDPEDLRQAQDGASLEKAETIFRKIRALNPEPGAWTTKEGKRMKILEAKLREEKLVIQKIQFEGKKPQDLRQKG